MDDVSERGEIDSGGRHRSLLPAGIVAGAPKISAERTRKERAHEDEPPEQRLERATQEFWSRFKAAAHHHSAYKGSTWNASVGRLGKLPLTRKGLHVVSWGVSPT